MANYRRFVTYFYDYSTGNKGGICGFGKLEYSMRSRIHITIQGKRTGREECVVYGMSGSEEGNQILGRFILNGGRGSFLWEWNGKEKEADLFVRNMVGIVLCIRNNGKEEVWAATQWNGAEFDRNRFGRDNRQYKQELDRKQVEKFYNESNKMDKKEIAQSDSCKKEEQKSNSNRCENKNTNLQAEICEDNNRASQSEICECKNQKQNTNGCEKKDQNMDSKDCKKRDQNAESNCCEDTNKNESIPENDIIWNQLCQKYAKFMPFPQSTHIQCLKIHLGDLRRFSNENRRLANNNFLLRGYYRCHYIVVSKWDTSYYIGIPGVYQEREAKLANHFGFCVFAPFKGGNASNGKSGLWLTPLNLMEEKEG